MNFDLSELIEDVKKGFIRLDWASTKAHYFLKPFPDIKLCFLCLILYWSIVDLWYCVSFRCTAKWFSYIETFFQNIFYYNLKILHILPCCLCILCIVVHCFFAHLCVCVRFVVSFYKRNTQAQYVLGFPTGSAVRNPPAHVGDLGLIPGLGKFPGEEMATHTSILAWENPWTEEPVGLQFMGSQRVGHCWATTQQYVLAKFTSLFHKE